MLFCFGLRLSKFPGIGFQCLVSHEKGFRARLRLECISYRKADLLWCYHHPHPPQAVPPLPVGEGRDQPILQCDSVKLEFPLWSDTCFRTFLTIIDLTFFLSIMISFYNNPIDKRMTCIQFPFHRRFKWFFLRQLEKPWIFVQGRRCKKLNLMAG